MLQMFSNIFGWVFDSKLSLRSFVASMSSKPTTSERNSMDELEPAGAKTWLAITLPQTDAEMKRDHHKHCELDLYSMRNWKHLVQLLSLWYTRWSVKCWLHQNSHYSYLVSKSLPCLTLLCCRFKVCGNVITSSSKLKNEQLNKWLMVGIPLFRWRTQRDMVIVFDMWCYHLK